MSTQHLCNICCNPLLQPNRLNVELLQLLIQGFQPDTEIYAIVLGSGDADISSGVEAPSLLLDLGHRRGSAQARYIGVGTCGKGPREQLCRFTAGLRPLAAK